MQVEQDIVDVMVLRINGMGPKEREQAMQLAVDTTVKLKFVPTPGPQVRCKLSKADIILFGGEGGGGKLLRLSESLVTPSGFIKMGDIKVGDALIDKDGAICHVTKVFNVDAAPELWRFRFDDCSEVISCIDHQWLTYDLKELSDLLKKSEAWKANRRAARPSRGMAIKTKSAKFYAALLKRNQMAKSNPIPLPIGTVRTTRDIINSITVRGRTNHAIPLCSAPDFDEKQFVVPPYTLGAWLGDGTSSSGGFTGIDAEIWERIESEGFEVRHGKGKDAYKCHHIQKLQGKLRELGVLDNKHIPQAYLRGSYQQRLALLQGLMDTDGTVARHSGSAEFCNTNERIVDGIYELICSLGWKVNKRSGRAKLNGKDCGEKWTLKFMPSDYVFYLPRKRNLQKLAERRTTKFRYIVGAEPVESEAGRCIAVDSPSRTYLIGDSFLTTHNTGLGVGLALTDHDRTLIMRRTGKELSFVISEAIKFNGTKHGFNGTPGQQRLETQDGRLIEFGSAQYLGDELSRRGIPHDYLYVDEAGEFLGQQIRNLIGWVRSIKEGQRCRVILGSNPPTSSDGDWMVSMFAPWLDPQHPNPAAQGELRWFIMDDEDDIEVEGPGVYEYKGQDLIAMSRTFIRSRLADNPYLRDTDYKARLDMMSEPMRSAVRDGNFMIARRDAQFQVIPTKWVMDAQARWTDRPPENVPMCAMGVDIAQGGADSTTLSRRHDGWFDQLLKFPGSATPTGNEVAGLVCANRRDEATIILDMGGGYGGAAFMRLCDNGLEDHIVSYKGSNKTTKRTADGKLKFTNTRMAAYWKMQEALDPAQPGGSQISLPPSHKLLSQLTAVRFKETPQGIGPAADSTKEAITERLGESPDEADAVVMCWFGGKTVANMEGGWQANRTTKALTVNIGHAQKKQNRV